MAVTLQQRCVACHEMRLRDQFQKRVIRTQTGQRKYVHDDICNVCHTRDPYARQRIQAELNPRGLER